MYKYKLNENFKLGDTSKHKGTEQTVTDIDPETKSVTWDVKQIPDYNTVHDMFKELTNMLKTLLSEPEHQNNIKLKTLSLNLKNNFNEYRSYLRQYHPKEYKSLKMNVNETSLTSSNSGFNSNTNGENIAIPFKKFKK